MGKAIPSTSTTRNAGTVTSRQRPFPCNFPGCKKGFFIKKHLIVHQQAHSTTRFACEMCDKTFQWEITLLKHIEREHADTDSSSEENNIAAINESSNETVIWDDNDMVVVTLFEPIEDLPAMDTEANDFNSDESVIGEIDKVKKAK